mmetsp:Transcript_40785/g.125924  ORF Transcript_40785/g.125924 Transcript_40785/m.125924 type:complete len:204 (-) Transcript_40785:391-1002(-)
MFGRRYARRSARASPLAKLAWRWPATTADTLAAAATATIVVDPTTAATVSPRHVVASTPKRSGCSTSIGGSSVSESPVASVTSSEHSNIRCVASVRPRLLAAVGDTMAPATDATAAVAVTAVTVDSSSAPDAPCTSAAELRFDAGRCIDAVNEAGRTSTGVWENDNPRPSGVAVRRLPTLIDFALRRAVTVRVGMFDGTADSG